MQAYSCLHALILMNKTKDQTSLVLSHDLYWENKMYKPKRSIRTRRRSFCTPKPEADLCMRVDLPLDKKTVKNQDRATEPLGRRGPAFSKTLRSSLDTSIFFSSLAWDLRSLRSFRAFFFNDSLRAKLSSP